MGQPLLKIGPRNSIKMRSSVSVTQVGNGPSESAGPSPNTAESTGVEAGEHAAIASTPGVDARSLDDAPIPTPVIPFHELAGIFPVGDDTSIRELARRIDGNVPIDPVILYEDKILDGTALYLASLMVGRAPTFVRYEGEDPVGFLIGRHLFRGPLSESQRAMAAARAATLQLGDNQHSKGLPIGRASDLLNVSSQSVSRAKFVLRHGTPDLIAAVDSDRVTVWAAWRECDRLKKQAAKDRRALLAGQHERPAQTEAVSESETAVESTSTLSPTSSVGQSETAHWVSEPEDAPDATIVSETWIWPGYIPSIGVTAAVGRCTLVPLVAAKLAATIAVRGRFPDKHTADCGSVLWASTTPPKQLLVWDYIHFARLEPNSNCTDIDFLAVQTDAFGLPMRHLSADLQRLTNELRSATEARLIVIDYLSDYLAYGDFEQDIARLGRALHALQVFAAEHATAVLLPMRLPCRKQNDVDLAAQLLRQTNDIDSVLVVDRDAGSTSGTLSVLNARAGRSAHEHRFHLRHKWNTRDEKVTVMEWDALVPVKENTWYF
jgi:hypothetical protein